MQKQAIVLENDSSSFKIHTNLNIENSAYLAKLLFAYVEQGKIDFELFSAVLYDLIKNLHKRLNEEKKRGKEIKPIYIFTEKEKFVITGDDSDILPEK